MTLLLADRAGLGWRVAFRQTGLAGGLMACQVASQLLILSLLIRTERFPLFCHQADQAFDVIGSPADP